MFLYDSVAPESVRANIDLESADIRAILVTESYVADASHEFLDEVDAGHRIGSAVALTGKSVSATGAFDANNVTWTSVAAGDKVAAVILYVHTGSEATSRLLAYIDAGIGLPRYTNGGNITFEWHNGANKIFRWRAKAA